MEYRAERDDPWNSDRDGERTCRPRDRVRTVERRGPWDSRLPFDWDGFYRSFDVVLRAGAHSAWSRRPAKLQGEDLCDCLQAVYCRLLESQEHLVQELFQQHLGAVRKYLFRLARRAVTDYFRRVSRDKRGGALQRLSLHEVEGWRLVAESTRDPEQRLLQRERVSTILRRLEASAATPAQARFELRLLRVRMAGYAGRELVAEVSKDRDESLTANQIYSRAARLRNRLRRIGIEHKGNVL